MTRSVVALFDSVTDADRAVTDLVQAGITRDHISVVANNSTGAVNTSTSTTTTTDTDHAGPVGGSLFGALVGAVVGLGAILIPGIGPVIAAGPLIGAAGAIAGAVIGGTTGGITGGLLGLGVPQEEIHYYAEGVRRGGTLVTANVDEGMATTAENIFERYNPVDIQGRASAWQKSGWKGFDENAQPYTQEEINRDREAYLNPTNTTTTTSGTTDTTTSTTRRARTYDRSAHV